MNLNIRQSFVGKLFRGRMYSVDPPEIQVDGHAEYDFYLMQVSISEVLHALTGEKVFRRNHRGQKGEWCIWTESRRRVLVLKRKGRRLHILFNVFQGSMQMFLEMVEDRIDTDQELWGYVQDVERHTTNEIEIPTWALKELEKTSKILRGKVLHVGTDFHLTPPPLPLSPQCIPKQEY